MISAASVTERDRTVAATTERALGKLHRVNSGNRDTVQTGLTEPLPVEPVATDGQCQLWRS